MEAEMKQECEGNEFELYNRHLMDNICCFFGGVLEVACCELLNSSIFEDVLCGTARQTPKCQKPTVLVYIARSMPNPSSSLLCATKQIPCALVMSAVRACPQEGFLRHRLCGEKGFVGWRIALRHSRRVIEVTELSPTQIALRHPSVVAVGKLWLKAEYSVI